MSSPPPPRRDSEDVDLPSNETPPIVDGLRKLAAPPPSPPNNAIGVDFSSLQLAETSDEITMQGYLTKLPLSYHDSSTIRKLAQKGKRRYFILNGNHLEYYETPNDSQPRGIITLGSGSYVVADSKSTQQFQVGFRETDFLEADRRESTESAASDPGSSDGGDQFRVLHLEAQHEVERENWVQAILSKVPEHLRGDPPLSEDNETRDRSESQQLRMTLAQQRLRADSDLVSLLTLPDERGGGEDRKVKKQGYLWKKGGSEGGRHNWNKRYFVLTKNLSYLKSKEEFEALVERTGHGEDILPKSGARMSVSNEDNMDQEVKAVVHHDTSKELPWYKTVPLDTFSVSKREKYEGQTFDFEINTLHKTLTCRAETEEERDDWIAAIMGPLREDEETKFTDCLYGEDQEYKRLSLRIQGAKKNPQPKEHIRASRQLQIL